MPEVSNARSGEEDAPLGDDDHTEQWRIKIRHIERRDPLEQQRRQRKAADKLTQPAQSGLVEEASTGSKVAERVDEHDLEYRASKQQYLVVAYDGCVAQAHGVLQLTCAQAAPQVAAPRWACE